jgi:TPR repeat protein
MQTMLARVIVFTLMAMSCLACTDEKKLDATRAAAEKGNATAQFFVGLRYHEGANGHPKDFEKAAFWWKKSAEQEFPDAEVGMGELYLAGRGVRRDSQEAFKFFQRAARHGDSLSCIRVATMYLEGQGVEPEPIMAYAWASAYSTDDKLNLERKKTFLDKVGGNLSETQIKEAERIAKLIRLEIWKNSR